MGRLHGTGRRLAFAFGALLLVFGAAAFTAVAGLLEVHHLLHEVKAQETGVRTALELSAAVRDQYAHQAHTITLGNDTHLAMYEGARTRVRNLLDAAGKSVRSPEECAWLEEIARSTAHLHERFEDRILPAALAGDRELVEREHAAAIDEVILVQDRADRLVASFEASMGNFEAHASAVEHTTYRWTFVLFVLAAVLAAVLGVYVARSIAVPVAALSAGAARIAAGDLDTRIVLDAPDELGQLAAEFNRMAAALKENQTKLVESEKLAGIGRLAAGVAHEINNPLAVILGYVRILGRKSAPDIAGDLRVVEEEAMRCQEIVEGLLELSRPARFEPEPVELRGLCEEIVERLGDTGQIPPAAVSIEGDGTVSGSPRKLRQVLTNLLKNAAEAAGDRGQVRARIAPASPGAVKVSVTDTGPGVPQHVKAHLFEPFFTTKPKGTGLGLAVSKAIARAHGGDIDVENAPGGGAVFTLRLPVHPAGSASHA